MSCGCKPDCRGSIRFASRAALFKILKHMLAVRPILGRRHRI